MKKHSTIILLLSCTLSLLFSSQSVLAQLKDVTREDINNVDSFLQKQLRAYLENDTTRIRTITTNYYRAEINLLRAPKKFVISKEMRNQFIRESKKNYDTLLKAPCSLENYTLNDYAINIHSINRGFVTPLYTYEIDLELKDKISKKLIYTSSIHVKNMGSKYWFLFYCFDDWKERSSTQFNYAKDHYKGY